MSDACAFWSKLLEMPPVKNSPKYCEFKLANINLGLLLNDFGDEFKGANCVPVFEFADDQIAGYIDRAKDLGASVILEGLDNPSLLSVVFADPWGNEFELSRFHD
jgi:predicted enzyme related to lactoylglutathione lyase